MSIKIHRALICTSTMQVLVGRAAMNMERIPEKDYIDHLFIFHPNLRGAEKNIVHLARKVGFDEIHDFSEEILTISNLYSLKNIFKRTAWQFGINKKIKTIIEGMKKKCLCSSFTGVFCRNPRKWEIFGIIYVLGAESYKQIEDGVGNYTQANTLAPIGKKRLLIPKIISYFSVIINSIRGISWRYTLPLVINRIKKEDSYMVHEYLGARVVGKELKRLIQNLAVGKSQNSVKVMIIGSAFITNTRIKISVYDEIEMYRYIVKEIKKRHLVDDKEIGFKPHPRFGESENQLLSKKLECQIIEDGLGIAELEFINSGLEAVYSFGSTASINAKELFGIDTWFIWIDFLRQDVKSAWIFEKAVEYFDIPVLTFDKDSLYIPLSNA